MCCFENIICININVWLCCKHNENEVVITSRAFVCRIMTVVAIWKTKMLHLCIKLPDTCHPQLQIYLQTEIYLYMWHHRSLNNKFIYILQWSWLEQLAKWQRDPELLVIEMECGYQVAGHTRISADMLGLKILLCPDITDLLTAGNIYSFIIIASLTSCSINFLDIYIYISHYYAKPWMAYDHVTTIAHWSINVAEYKLPVYTGLSKFYNHIFKVLAILGNIF